MNQYYQKRIIAFIDILGFKTKVDDSLISKTVARKLHTALKRILQIKLDNEDLSSVLEMKSYGVEITTFSDSAVISYPADDIDGLFYLLLDLVHLQLELASYDVLLRGGITIGDLYHDGSIVYGPAMNEAYLLESKKAKYPRIIADVHNINDFIKQQVKLGKADHYDVEDILNLLKQDRDGKYFVDMLRQDRELSNTGDEYFQWLKSLRTVIVEGLNRYASPQMKWNEKLYRILNRKFKQSVKQNRDIFIKYEWLKEYYDSVVGDEEAYYPVPQCMERAAQKLFRKGYNQLRIRYEAGRYI
ncbi:MAG: hypothetical protein NC412_07295 [Roseburia sp.]|nr:hypothetical protein [Roseburia sp.]MCM1277637.1 hypothetical protein [Robinsoniella sp.]